MRTIMKTTIAVCLTLISAAALADVDYRFDQVKRKVELNASQVAAGHHARSGDKVQTGWFSYALIASDHYRARFEIYSSTNVQLAGGTPGVILSLERGHLHAIFDKITGIEPRVVQTPGALLAVRGTQYDVDVDRDGKTSLKVYEGTVEVQSMMQPLQPMLVHAGEMADFGRHQAPNVRPMPPDDHGRGQRDPHGISDPGHGKDPHGDGRDHPPPPRGTNPPPPPGKPDGHH